MVNVVPIGKHIAVNIQLFNLCRVKGFQPRRKVIQFIYTRRLYVFKGKTGDGFYLAVNAVYEKFLRVLGGNADAPHGGL